MAFYLKPEQTNRFVHVGHQNQRFNRDHLMHINIGIDECYSNEIVVFQLPQIDFLTDSGDQKAQHVRYCRNRTFLLFDIDFFEFVLGQWFARFGHDLNYIVNQYLKWKPVNYE